MNKCRKKVATTWQTCKHKDILANQNNCILKTTLTSEVSSNNDIEVTVNDDDIYISPNDTKIVDKDVAADLETIAQSYFCSIYNMSFSIQNGIAWCNDCNNISAQSTCKSKVYLGSSIVKDDDQSKLHITVFHSIIERKFDLPLSITTQNFNVCKLINKTYLFSIDQFKKCMELVDN